MSGTLKSTSTSGLSTNLTGESLAAMRLTSFASS
jgi:hypothetical protein